MLKKPARRPARIFGASSAIGNLAVALLWLRFRALTATQSRVSLACGQLASARIFAPGSVGSISLLGKKRPYGTTDSVRNRGIHGCEPNRGLPSGTAEPHAKELVMKEGITYVGMDVHKRTIAVSIRYLGQ
jgi:hypothetical protein